jgi:hypothetical protein
MGAIEERLQELELELPAPLAARDQGFNYVLVNVAGSIAYLAGHGPQDGGQPTPLMTGRIGDDLSAEEGYRAARLVGLAMVASLKQELGELDRVSRWLRAVGYINAAHDFTGHALVLNGFSDLIVEIWGDAGYHTRAAPGAATLPFNLPVIAEATRSAGLTNRSGGSTLQVGRYSPSSDSSSGGLSRPGCRWAHAATRVPASAGCHRVGAIGCGDHIGGVRAIRAHCGPPKASTSCSPPRPPPRSRSPGPDQTLPPQ